ncbi:hypothetical protein [Streptomyces sp. NBC_00443]|uniref:hypothetical protein n=1 Tax=Streptomyces sp. NBC_00443 TaxID=2975743 RepID=UPI002E1EC240
MTTETATTEPPPDTARGTIVHPTGPDDVAVYRLYDAAGALLYVGASKDPVHRWADEHRHTHWWSQVASFDWTWHPSRKAARAIERDLLAAGGGRYNVHGTPRHGPNQLRQRAAARA